MSEREELLEAEKLADKAIYDKARGCILEFTKYTKNDYSINWHHIALANALNKFVFGDPEYQYVMVFMPPRHGKSELVSRRLPAFIHGHYPDDEIMAASYLDSLAGDMTIDVQKVIDSQEYKNVFPGTKIWAPGTSYSKGTRNSAEHTIVGRNGKYRGQGVGGSFTGKGANWIIVDDPIKGREIADSIAFRERLWNFYNNDLFSRRETRLDTGRKGRVLITQCMTGDAHVLMADGTETNLRDIKIGDAIATYDNGRISISTVKKWKCQGPDYIIAIRTSSGITVKANERHPFLVCRNGILEWVRLRDLRLNDKMIRVGAGGKENCAHTVDVKSQQSAKACACHIIAKPNGPQGIGRHRSIQTRAEPHIYGKDIGLKKKTTIQNLLSRMVIAPFAKLVELVQSIGIKNSVLTTTTSQEKLEDCSATSAISQSSTGTLKKYCSALSITYDHIIEIVENGYEDVFDIEVDRTENFIANGLVSHNTRWHEDDLSGRLIELAKKDPEAVQWKIIEFPAIKVDNDNPDDPRKIGEALWDKKYSVADLMQIKATSGPRAWSSLYQQNPVPDGGGLFRDSMFRFVDLPQMFAWRFITADTAYNEKKENDFTVFSLWGVNGDQLYLIDVWMDQVKAVEVESKVEPWVRKHVNYGYRGTWIEPRGHGIYLNQKWRNAGLLIPSDEDLQEFYHDRKFDKVERANNVAPYLANRFVAINNSLSNKEDLVAQALGFPKAKHDDWVDTLVDALKRVYAHEVSTLDAYR